MSALTHRQKQYLARLSDQAYAFVCRERDPLVDEVEEHLSESARREQFRHAQVARACGKAGLRCCTQLDYKLVEQRLLELSGRHAAAFQAGVAACTETRRQAEAVLIRACEQSGLRLAYAEAICRRQFKCPLSDATDRQLWNLVYTIRNRSKSRPISASDPGQNRPIPAQACDNYPSNPHQTRTVKG